MAIKVLLPKLGLTMQEGTLEEWLVAPGTRVSVGDPLLRIGTDKVDADVEAEESGILHPVAQEGAVLPPGAIIGWLLEEGEEPPAEGPAAASAPEDTGAAPAARVPESANPAVDPSELGRRPSSPNARRVAGELSVDMAEVTGTGPGGRIVSEDVEEYAEASTPTEGAGAGGRTGGTYTPLVRRDADALGVDLDTVRGTGAGGRVTRTDVATAAERATASPSRPSASSHVIPLTGMRGAIARNMTSSLQEMAQLTHGFEVDVTRLLALRADLKCQYADTDLVVPGLNDFVVLAAARALRSHPILNASVREDGIHLLEDINVGVAVAVPDGLMVPVVPGADRLTVGGIATRIRELAASARSGSLRLDELEGATFAVTSLGSYGVDFFTPVINPGNVGILGVGRIRDGVRWEGDVPRRTDVLTLSLTFDHRAVDGAPAAEYLQTVAGLLGSPLRLLA